MAAPAQETQETLYRLPTFSRQHRQAVFFNALFFLVANSLLACLQATEYLAVRWRFHPVLGRVWLRAAGYPFRPLLFMTLLAAAGARPSSSPSPLSRPPPSPRSIRSIDLSPSSPGAATRASSLRRSVERSARPRRSSCSSSRPTSSSPSPTSRSTRPASSRP